MTDILYVIQNGDTLTVVMQNLKNHVITDVTRVRLSVSKDGKTTVRVIKKNEK